MNGRSRGALAGTTFPWFGWPRSSHMCSSESIFCGYAHDTRGGGGGQDWATRPSVLLFTTWETKASQNNSMLSILINRYIVHG
jgi:hypothetical protein